MKDFIKNRIKSDDGFLGETHAMSAVAGFLLLVLFAKDYFLNQGITDNVIVLLIASFVVAGAALIPDLDNTKSTAMSVLGPVGTLLSTAMRSIATAIFYITRSRFDDKVANPHRGFWHTFLSGLVLGLIVKYTTSINVEINNDFLINYNFNNVGDLLALFWIFLTTQLAFSALLNKFNKGGLINKLILVLLGLAISIALIYFNSDDYNWLVILMVLGYFIHIVGDSLTVAGIPLLFPFKIKGKRWYTISFLPIRAGGEIENHLILPLFTVVSIVSAILIVVNSFGY